MDLIEIAKTELIKTGMSKANAEKFACEMFDGFSLRVIEKFAQQKFKEGAIAQKSICANTKLLKKYCHFGLELTQSIRYEVINAPDATVKDFERIKQSSQLIKKDGF